jgi:hypothetical protein
LINASLIEPRPTSVRQQEFNENQPTRSPFCVAIKNLAQVTSMGKLTFREFYIWLFFRWLLWASDTRAM